MSSTRQRLPPPLAFPSESHPLPWDGIQPYFLAHLRNVLLTVWREVVEGGCVVDFLGGASEVKR